MVLDPAALLTLPRWGDCPHSFQRRENWAVRDKLAAQPQNLIMISNHWYFQVTSRDGRGRGCVSRPLTSSAGSHC